MKYGEKPAVWVNGVVEMAYHNASSQQTYHNGTQQTSQPMVVGGGRQAWKQLFNMARHGGAVRQAKDSGVNQIA